MTSKVEKTEVEEREIPVIKPGDVTIQLVGQIYKTVVVNLPEDLIFQDLNDHPEIWKLVQADRSGAALAEFDKLELRARDWTVYAAVNHADAGQVILYDIRKASKPMREVALYSDKTFEVRWARDGYTYFRKADGVKMAIGTYPTAEAAKAALIREQYPVTVSSI